MNILATDDLDPLHASPRIWFEGTVNLGETFTMESFLAGESKFASRSYVHVFDPAGNLLQSVEFHTSCSQPLGANDQFGSLRLIGLTPE